MIFLKRFHLNGFKSFAKSTVLTFDNTMVGIIGPNGSGKSNIIDALRWTLGEYSTKTLRGKEKSDMIFNGSNDMDPSPEAFVELTFDNTNRVLHYDNDIVKIGRKLIRSSGENIYYLNDEKATLNEIRTIFADSGFGKGSLNLISQGSVNWFAEAKPEERRNMFESAAGIGKYIKQKEETLKNLESARHNLEALEVNKKHLEKEINDLKKQAAKAKIYQEKRAQLKLYDVSIGVQEYLAYKSEIEQSTSSIDNSQIRINELELNNKKYKELMDINEVKYQRLINQTDDLNEKINTLNNEISSLTYEHTKYITNLENKIDTGTIQDRIEAYKNLINSEKQNCISLERQLNESNNQLEEFASSIISLKNNYEIVNKQYSESFHILTKKQNELQTLNSQNNSANSHDRGVQQLLKSKNIIPGIHNTVAQLISVPKQYELLIQTALGKALNNLVVDNNKVSINAIKFLKDNRAGRATFLPLDIIKPKTIKPDTLLIMNQLNGFIDTANNLIECDDLYRNVIDSLLGNIGVTDTIENANNIAKAINYNYKLISLDGDTVYVGGVMSGGQAISTNRIIFNIQEKIDQLTEEVASIREKHGQLEIDRYNTSDSIRELENKISSTKFRIQNLKSQIEISQNSIKRNTTDLESLDSSANTAETETKIQKTQQQIIDLTEQKNNLEFELSQVKINRDNAYDELIRHKDLYSKHQIEYNNETSKYYKQKSHCESLQNKIEIIENNILNNYSMTMEIAVQEYNKPLDILISDAKRIITQLKSEINELGNINFDAVETLDKKQEELDTMIKDYNESLESVNSFESLIHSLDTQAKQNFMRVINSVNEHLPIIFSKLFGGGTCEIKLVDEHNVLESGIEVYANPPGKKITRLGLLSGGEKTLIALSVLFSLLKSSKFPLVLLDEAEAALDQANVNTFAKLVKVLSDECQFIIITHRSGTMKLCETMYGTTMQIKGVTSVVKKTYEAFKNAGTVKE